MKRASGILTRVRERLTFTGGAGATSQPQAEREPAPKTRQSTAAKSRYDHRRAAGQRLLHIDLPEWQVAIIDREARQLGVSRVGWVRTLIANRMRDEPRFTREAELALFDVVRGLRAMNQDLVTFRRRFEGNSGPEAVSVVCQIERQQVLLEELRSALKAAFASNLDYWRTPE